MYQEIRIRRLSAGTVFKLVAIGSGISTMLYSLIIGVLAMFGASSVHMNGQTVTGIMSLPTSLLLGLIMTGIVSLLLGGSMAFGLWLYAKFRPLQLLAQTEDDDENT